jgi:hypothetical protein
MNRRSILVMLMGLLFTLLACKKEKSYPEGKDGLKQLATDLSAASGSDATKMGEALAIPEPDKWFAATFGPEMGPKLATEYAGEKAKLSSIGTFFTLAKVKGRTEILVEEHKGPDDDGENGLQEAAIRAMKTPITIYTINCVEPGKTIGASLWSFAYVDGKFRYLGKMKATKPDASPLDELSKKDLKDALGGSGGP